MKILMVDEQSLARKILGDFMEKLGHEVTAISSIEDYISSGTPNCDVVLVDPLGFHEQSMDTIHRVHELLPGAHQVIVSAMDKVLSVEAAMENNVFSYLKKPVRLQELELVLTRVAEYRQIGKTS